jgi:hypothetical protein
MKYNSLIIAFLLASVTAIKY